MAVTGMTDAQALAHIDAAAELWEWRSRHTWTLDLSALTDAGITLAPPPGAADRAATAERGTTRRQRRPQGDGPRVASRLCGI